MASKEWVQRYCRRVKGIFKMIFLEPISLSSCLKMAREIDVNDSDSERSTFLYDKAEHINDFSYYRIIDDLNVIGFTILKPKIAGIVLFWLSLYKEYRGHRNYYGAKATYTAMYQAFEKMRCKMIYSEVFESNKPSMRVHHRIMNHIRKERTLNGEPVHLFGMDRAKYVENLEKYGGLL